MIDFCIFSSDHIWTAGFCENQLVVNSSFSTSPSSIFLSTCVCIWNIINSSSRTLSLSSEQILIEKNNVQDAQDKFNNISSVFVSKTHLDRFFRKIIPSLNPTLMQDLQLLASSTIFMLFFTCSLLIRLWCFVRVIILSQICNLRHWHHWHYCCQHQHWQLTIPDASS